MTLLIYTLYRNPRDYPGQWVVRRYRVVSAVVEADLYPLYVGDSRDEAEAAVRNAARFPIDWIDRMEDDDPAIVGVWM